MSIFIDNKYTRWYFTIISNAQSRDNVTGYTEKHHIIPRSLGGNNQLDNLVVLTAREHFVCHLLLPSMLEGKNKRKMYHALWNMANQFRDYQERYKVTSHLYEIIRKKNAEALKIENTGKPSKNKGRTISPEWREKLRQANLGKKRSSESCAKQAATMLGRKLPPRSIEWCKNLSESKKRNVTNEWRKMVSNRNKGRTYLINEVEQRCIWVKNETVQHYLENGWVVGRKRFPKNN